ncbi:MAG: DUF3300 domain-containing protein [Phycisphaerae bacterium]|nr:DUF3300 domain-containing protein [Phycisphaerae bacterium]
MKGPPLCIVAILLSGVAPGAPQATFAQAPAAADTAAQAPVKLGAAELQKLVAPIALYPDALLAHVLPASTAGLDVVQAARFLRKNNGKAEPKPDAKWNTSVFVLLQFPDVLYRMDENLDWTDNLGKAVLAQQADVMKAIQQVRTTAMANGALQTNDKQKVVVEQEAVKIAPANPQVVYVPTYNPDVVVVNQTSPNYTAAAATVGFAAGVVVGALLADDHCDWHGGYVAHGVYPVPYGTYARPAAPYNPRGVYDPRGAADPRGRYDPRGVRDPRGAADPRGVADPRGARDPRGAADRRGVADPRGAAGRSGGSFGSMSSGARASHTSMRGRSSLGRGGRGRR